MWGTIVKEHYFLYAPTLMTINDPIREFSCGHENFMVISHTGRVYSFGDGPNLGFQAKKPVLKFKQVDGLLK